MDIALSVIMCTFNRASYLRKALQSLLRQSLPPESFEILVVDNASTDETRQMLAKEFSSTINLRSLHEPTLGVSRARNTGWRHAQGKYVAYLDDDALASPDWCCKILNAFRAYDSKIACIGGKIELIWEAPCPDWVSATMQNYFSVPHWSSTPKNLVPGEWLSSCNLAFPKHLLEKTEGFKTYLDRRGNSLLSMGEIVLQRELQQRGYQCIYDQHILVRHHVPAHQLTKKWFLRRAWWNGISVAYADIYQKKSSYDKSLIIGQHAVENALSGLKWCIMTAIAPTLSSRLERACFMLERLGYFWGLGYRKKEKDEVDSTSIQPSQRLL
ncbi:MAG: glycosyltransferase family 2 protein [bacterium]|nr:glycosyltransferase family 2 protein [bacterium]